MITISEFTKQEVIEVLGTAPEKVHAIPIAVEEPFTPDGPRAEGDYVLSVGTLEPRKNLRASGRGRAARRSGCCGWSARKGGAG